MDHWGPGRSCTGERVDGRLAALVGGDALGDLGVGFALERVEIGRPGREQREQSGEAALEEDEEPSDDLGLVGAVGLRAGSVISVRAVCGGGQRQRWQ